VNEKIPSYKYKFKQIFKKIGQNKALDLFYFVDVLTWTVKVKNKHISVGIYIYIADWVSEWVIDYCLTPIQQFFSYITGRFNTNSAIFQLYHGEI
jgi:hypothetical protein